MRSERRVRRTGTVGEYVPSAQNIPAPPSYVATAPAPGRPGVFLPRRAKAGYNREQYDRIDENPFVSVAAAPRSTFSLDPDRASYANVRRFLRAGERPPADAVRLEEFINYFPYHAPDPQPGEALCITTDVARAPWRPDHQLVRITLQARRPDPAALPPSNLVFLIDVSGSMFEPDKLPLVKRALGVLVSRLRPIDRVALVAYAGNAGLVLPSTSGEDTARILAAIDRLEAGGSTAGGEGLELAYRVARENARPGANSRVVLATDGDFNVGPSSDAAMERLVESKRAEGTYLTVLGFGEGNLQDAKMKKLAKRGNGDYAYVDNSAEAEKVFGQELGGTLVTVANDAKVQVEFNPAVVRTYRLIGYEGRLLRNEDFADDQKDAGDVGAGHTVTAFYEIVPARRRAIRHGASHRSGMALRPRCRSRARRLASCSTCSFATSGRASRRAGSSRRSPTRHAQMRHTSPRRIFALRARWPSSGCCSAIRRTAATRAPRKCSVWRAARSAMIRAGTGRSSCDSWSAGRR